MKLQSDHGTRNATLLPSPYAYARAPGAGVHSVLLLNILMTLDVMERGTAGPGKERLYFGRLRYEMMTTGLPQLREGGRRVCED